MKCLDNKPTVVVYSGDHETGACAVIRILGPMLANNWNVIWSAKQSAPDIPFEFDVARQADVIIIQRQYPSELTEKILRAIISLGIPIVFDLDDMLLDIPSNHPCFHGLKKHKPYIKWILKEADIITVSTNPLKKSLSKYTGRPIHVNPNFIDFNLFHTPPKLCNNQFNFLVSGTSTHQRDWALIEEPIVQILKIYEEKVNFVFFGDTPKRFIDHPAVNFIDYQSNYKQYATQLKELDVHAALIPLEDTKFNQGKSNIKWLEYSAAGIPGAFSDITPYNSCIRHEQNGLLVKNNPDSWFDAMNQLILDSEKTAHLIKNAQSEVRERYSIESSLAECTSVVNSLLGQKHQRNIVSELPVFQYRLEKNITKFLDRHINWRFK